MNTPEQEPSSNPRAPTPLRLISLAAVGVVFVLYRPGAEPSLLNTGVLPLLGLLATWYLTHSVAVIAIGVLFLAGAHSDLDSADLLAGRIYPVLTAAAAAVVTVIFSNRFRHAMDARRRMRADARAAEACRDSAPGPAPGPDPGSAPNPAPGSDPRADAHPDAHPDDDADRGNRS